MFMLAAVLFVVSIAFVLVSMLRTLERCSPEEKDTIYTEIMIGWTCVIVFGLSAFAIRAWAESDVLWFLYR